MRGCHFPIITLSLALSLLTPAVRAVEFAGGTGTPDDPYQIATAEQFIAAFASNFATRTAVSMSSRNLPGSHFVLGADIDLDPNLPGGRVFDLPVLSLTTGSFDGRGYRIMNLHIFRYGRPSELGAEAIVRNVTFERAVVDGDRPILASINKGYVINCRVKGILGGVGLVEENQGYIMGCSVVTEAGGTCGVAGKNSGGILFSHVTGGLATDGGLVRENSGTIFDCYSTADVFGQTTAGGLVGTNSGSITRCYATGGVSATVGKGAYKCSAGGLAGANSGVISDSYALGTATATGADPYYTDIGGLVGDNRGMVLRCYATGAGGAGLTGNSYSVMGLVAGSYFLAPGDGGGSINGPGIPLSGLQMQRRESFLGWDFRGSSVDGTSDTWDMPEGGGYPILTAIGGPTFSGSGTAEDPYLIESADQLMALSYDVGAHYRLATDIDLRGQSFSRCVIPTFLGRLDGDDHAVFNFTFTGEDDPGLFGILYAGATITRLNLWNVHVVAPESDLPRLAGVLAARNGGRITACSVRVDTVMWGSNSGTVPAEYVGGLVAVNETSGEVSRCFVSWVAAGSFNRGGMANWGGIAGHNAGRIAECHVSAQVSGYIRHCAALVGRNDGLVMDCYADGYCLVAGLVYSNGGQIANSYAAVMVPPGWNTGGLVAENAPAVSKFSTETVVGTITNSYFLAETDGGGPDNGLGVVLSDAQMRRQANFNGWDFAGLWTICEGKGYPRLRWEDGACEP